MAIEALGAALWAIPTSTLAWGMIVAAVATFFTLLWGPVMFRVAPYGRYARLRATLVVGLAGSCCCCKPDHVDRHVHDIGMPRPNLQDQPVSLPPLATPGGLQVFPPWLGHHDTVQAGMGGKRCMPVSALRLGGGP